MSKSEMMNKVLEATMAKYGCATRAEAYPYVLGMATVLLEEEDLKSMLDVVS